MRIQWTPSLSVGIDEIDRLQRDFFAAAERVTRTTTATDVVFEAALRSLLDVACTQFAAEERWLREAADPSLPRHELEHRRFLADLASYANQVSHGQRAGRRRAPPLRLRGGLGRRPRLGRGPRPRPGGPDRPARRGARR